MRLVLAILALVLCVPFASAQYRGATVNRSYRQNVFFAPSYFSSYSIALPVVQAIPVYAPPVVAAAPVYAQQPVVQAAPIVQAAPVYAAYDVAQVFAAPFAYSSPYASVAFGVSHYGRSFGTFNRSPVIVRIRR